jgi:E3 ubiquitin-protein ligase UHRF1
MAINEYEKQRQANIERNNAMLAELGLDKPFFEPKETKRPSKTVSKKRKQTPEQDFDSPTPAKAARIPSTDEQSTRSRRSQRNIGKTVDYKGEVARGLPAARVQAGLIQNDGKLGREGGKRRHDPYVSHCINMPLDDSYIIGKNLDTSPESQWEHGGKPGKLYF